MLTTGLRITPLRNEDRYAPAFLLAALQFFFFYYLFANLLLFLIFPSLWCVPAIKCVYVCTCATQIAVDGFNQMAAPFCCSQLLFFFLPLGARPLAFVLRPPEKRATRAHFSSEMLL